MNGSGSVASDGLETFDVARALGGHRYDPILLCDIAEAFIDTYPCVLGELAAALAHPNLQEVLRLANKLKAGLMVLCAPSALDVAEDFELAADKGRLSRGATVFRVASATPRGIRDYIEIDAG